MRGTEKGCFWAFEVGSRSEALAFSLAHGVNINPLVHSVADHGLPLPSGRAGGGCPFRGAAVSRHAWLIPTPCRAVSWLSPFHGEHAEVQRR